jgi:hypothetical protein
MKKVLRIALKVILAIIFLQNIGLFSFISRMPTEKMAPQKIDGGKEDNKYLNDKIRKAENLGDNYGPEKYFADLTEIKLKTKNNDFDRYAVINVSYTTNVLASKFHENVTNHKKSDSPKDYDNYMKRLTDAQQKHIAIADPEMQKRDIEFKIETSRPTYWRDTLINILSWLLGFYLRNLPLALVLLWLWWYEDKNKISINNPLSFAICLILYPIVIIRTWMLKTREVSRIFKMSVDYKRRQIDIFSLISDNEFEKIKHFAKSDLKISDYQNYLKNRGLSYQHSLIPAMMVTFVFLLSSQLVGAEVKHQSDDFTKCQVCIKAPPDFEVDKPIQHEKFSFGDVLPPKQEMIFIMILVWQLVLPPTSKRCQGFQTNPDPIPLVA